MKIFHCFFLTSLIVIGRPSYAAGNRLASSYCGPEYFESEDSMEDLPPLEEFIESLADLKIYSTSDFFTVKREEGLPDGISDKPLRAYPELQGKWSNLWDKVHALRQARGEEIEEKRKLSSGELKALVTKMVNTFDREEIPEEEFPIETEDDTDLSEETEDTSLSLITKKPSNNRRRTRLKKQEPHDIQQQGKDKQEKPKVYNDESHPTDTPLITSPQKAAEPAHHDPQEERKKAVLTLITENRYITKAEIAKKLRVSNRTIDRVINSLKQEKRLKRTGNNNSGYWDVLQNGVKLFHYDPQEERKETILALIDENNRITIAELSKKMKLNRATIGEIIAILKQEKQIERIGNSRNGQWVILKSGVIPSHYASPEERKETVLALIDENPYITRAEMAEKLGVSKATISEATSILKQEKRLERVGNSTTGHWKIPNKETISHYYTSPEERTEAVLALINANPYITRAEMAKSIRVSTSTIGKDIASLKQTKRIERVGDNENGYYRILEKGVELHSDSPGERKETVLALINENPEISLAQLAEQMGVSKKAIYRTIAELKEKEILVLIDENPQITRAELAEKTGLLISIIYETTRKLRREGRLRRLGPNNHYGAWEVPKKGIEPSHYNPQKEREEKILALIDENPQISLSQLAKKTGLSKTIVHETTTRLKDKKLLARAGSSSNGYWEKLEPGATPSYYNPQKEREEKILALIDENPYITQPEMAKSIGVSTYTIDNATSLLRQDGRLERRGNKRTGRWKILK